MTINDIRNLLTRETKEKLNSTEIICTTSRDKNMLIIKSTTEENVNKLLKTTDDITTLKNIIEITYKSTNLKKVIILGVPKDISEDDILKQIENLYNLEVPAAINKIIKKDHSKNYQLVLELEDWAARDLVQRKRLQKASISHQNIILGNQHT